LDNHHSTYLTKLKKEKGRGACFLWMIATLATLKKIPKNKSTTSREHKEMGMGTAKIFHFVTY
jgi:hypothetical protein